MALKMFLRHRMSMIPMLRISTRYSLLVRTSSVTISRCRWKLNRMGLTGDRKATEQFAERLLRIPEKSSVLATHHRPQMNANERKCPPP